MFSRFSRLWVALSVVLISLSTYPVGSAAEGLFLHLQSVSVDPRTFLVEGERVPEEWQEQELFVVQFKEPIVPQKRQWLKSQSVEIISYLPDQAFLVRVESPKKVLGFVDGQPGLLQDSRVRAVVPYFPEWKVSPDFGPFTILTQNQFELSSLRLRSGEDLEAVSARASELVQSNRLQPVQLDGNHLIMWMRRGVIHQVATWPEVLWIEPQLEITTMLVERDQLLEGVALGSPPVEGQQVPLTGYESGTRIMGFEPVWERGLTGRGQIVAFADTGLDQGDLRRLHRDFSNVIKGYHFGFFARDWSDPQGHGTHVAGSVGGTGAASQWRIRGGAFDVNLIPQGLWSPLMNNISMPPQASNMFRPAYQDGARIHTNSWGMPNSNGNYNNFSAQMDEFMWQHPEFLLVFAAGNDGADSNRNGRIDEGTVSAPGTAKNVLTVGASENYLLEGGIQRPLRDLFGGQRYPAEPLASDLLSDDPNGLAAFSSRGPARDGRLKPEVVAPGTNIVSNCSTVSGASDLWGKMNDDYCYAGGTSMSTPLVAGAAAVLRQHLVQDWGIEAPTAPLVKAILMHSADDLFPGQYGLVGASRGQEILNPGPGMAQGFGRVNIDRATSSEAFHVMAQGLTAGGQLEAIIYSTPDPIDELRVTMVFLDAPALPNAARTLINDLDLVVTLDDGRRFTSQDRTNPFEHLVIEGLNAYQGKVQIDIHTHKMPEPNAQGGVPWALVVSAGE